MLAITVVMLYPMLYVVFASFSDATAFMKSSGLLYKPAGFSLEAYKLALGYPMLLRGYINTVFIIFFGVIIGIILTSIGAYGLTRKNVKLQQFLNISIIITMFFSGGMIPFYITVKDLGLTDNIWSLILPSAVSTFNLMILKVSFASIPDGLTESATIDGAGHFTLLFRIIMPVSKATLAVLVLYYAVGHWNSWFNAMMFIDDRNKYPLQLVLREVLITSDTSSMTAGTSDQEFIGETIKHAVIVISTVPILCVYPFLQKYFTKGVMIGSVKG
ncbi:MAG: carbohydrate ABC transporter permease [Clostridia bacterium]|nr:carbohydrate ABC transporter permease [Clostridia bacterium]